MSSDLHNKSDDQITNSREQEQNSSFAEICARRFSRRDLLKAGLAVGASAAVGGLSACSHDLHPDSSSGGIEEKAIRLSGSSFDFVEIEHGIDQYHHVAPDHSARVLLRWGDPILADAPEYDLDKQTAEKQLQQFGYNNDYVGYLGLEPKPGQQARALLCINHEYPKHSMMFPGLGANGRTGISAEQVAISQASVGNSIVEIMLVDGDWQVDLSSKYNRRISALATEMEISGPVAGHPRLGTSADPTAKTIIGTFNNCAGGLTPWGTYLTCEENFNYHFTGTLAADHPEAVNHQRYNVPVDLFKWGAHDKRFDIGVEPNEPNRFGWVVEIDPLDPDSTPKKRTALGRFKHEGAESVIAPDGRLVIYMGDDQRFEYLYKFVSRDRVDTENHEANRDLLDHGTLYVAKFMDDGSLEWRPLSIDNELLQAQFSSQAEILIEPRRAADLLEATPMDRPEDVVPNPHTGKVYVMLTNNTTRETGNVANPRAKNYFGHIIEIDELSDDPSRSFAGTRATWDMLVKCGDPNNTEHQAQWNSRTSENGWFASPDNGVIDPHGRLWVATDQGPKTHLSGTCDGLWSMETEGPLRGTGKMFFRVPIGAEMCGPAFSDDGESLFLAVQHPGSSVDGTATSMENPTTRWPDFEDGKPTPPGHSSGAEKSRWPGWLINRKYPQTIISIS